MYWWFLHDRLNARLGVSPTQGRWHIVGSSYPSLPEGVNIIDVVLVRRALPFRPIIFLRFHPMKARGRNPRLFTKVVYGHSFLFGDSECQRPVAFAAVSSSVEEDKTVRMLVWDGSARTGIRRKRVYDLSGDKRDGRGVIAAAAQGGGSAMTEVIKIPARTTRQAIDYDRESSHRRAQSSIRSPPLGR